MVDSLDPLNVMIPFSKSELSDSLKEMIPFCKGGGGGGGVV